MEDLLLRALNLNGNGLHIGNAEFLHCCDDGGKIGGCD